MRNFFLIYLHKVNSLLHTYTNTPLPHTPFIWAGRWGDRDERGAGSGWELSPGNTSHTAPSTPLPGLLGGQLKERHLQAGSSTDEGPACKAKAPAL